MLRQRMRQRVQSLEAYMLKNRKGGEIANIWRPRRCRRTSDAPRTHLNAPRPSTISSTRLTGCSSRRTRLPSEQSRRRRAHQPARRRDRRIPTTTLTACWRILSSLPRGESLRRNRPQRPLWNGRARGRQTMSQRPSAPPAATPPARGAPRAPAYARASTVQPARRPSPIVGGAARDATSKSCSSRTAPGRR